MASARWGLALGILATLFSSSTGWAQSNRLDLIIGNNFSDGSAIAVSTNFGVFEAGTHFDVAVEDGPSPTVVRLRISGVSFPRVNLAFGQNYRIDLRSETNQPTDEFTAELNVLTGRIRSGSEPPLHLRVRIFQSSLLLATANFDVPITTATLAPGPCGETSISPLVGTHLGDATPGRVTIYGYVCIDELGTAGFDQPLTLKVEGDLDFECSDGIDNDQDGLIDLADPGCANVADPFEGGLCGNGVLDEGEQCDDGNGSNSDCCNSACIAAPNGLACSDFNACTLVDSCNAVGECVPGAPLDCDDGTFCNGVEGCNLLIGCVPGQPLPIDDGISCTNDSCDEALAAIVHAPVHSACSDGLFCNGSELCDPQADCQAGDPIDPDDGLICTEDRCDEDLDIVVNDPIPECTGVLVLSSVSGPASAPLSGAIQLTGEVAHPDAAPPSLGPASLRFLISEDSAIEPGVDPVVGQCQIATIGAGSSESCQSELFSLPATAGERFVAACLEEDSVLDPCTAPLAIQVPEPGALALGLSMLATLFLLGLEGSTRARRLHPR